MKQTSNTPIPFFFIGFGIILLLVTSVNAVTDRKRHKEYRQTDVKTVYDARKNNLEYKDTTNA